MAAGIKMKIARIAAVVVCTATMTGCSTIIEGTHQDIAVSTTPDGAHCEMTRKGEKIATVEKTPGKVTVQKTKDDILLGCTMAGYQNSSQYLHSGMAAGTFGNIIAGGLVGWAVDSSTGADNKYPESVNVILVPQNGAAPVAQPPATVRNSLAPTG